MDEGVAMQNGFYIASIRLVKLKKLDRMHLWFIRNYRNVDVSVYR